MVRRPRSQHPLEQRHQQDQPGNPRDDGHRECGMEPNDDRERDTDADPERIVFVEPEGGARDEDRQRDDDQPPRFSDEVPLPGLN